MESSAFRSTLKFVRVVIGLLVLAPRSHGEPAGGGDGGYGGYDSSASSSGDSSGSDGTDGGVVTVSITPPQVDDSPDPVDAPPDDGGGDGDTDPGTTPPAPPPPDPAPAPDATPPPPAPAPDPPPPPPPPPPVPGASVIPSPSAGTAPLTTIVYWYTSDADSAVVAGDGLASSDLDGAQYVTLYSPGDYTYTITASGAGGQVTQSATVSVSAPLYNLSTYTIGNGSVTPGGTYPAGTQVSVSASPGGDSWFAGWTGSVTAPDSPLSVTMNGDTVLYANFALRLAQTISFSPPATARFPGSPVVLTATASSGLPVSLAVVSGPATLNGNQLTLNGTGTVVVQATQSGNSQWLPAAPVTGTLNAASPLPVSRIRFNATGTDSHIVNQPGTVGSSFIWTDPAGLQVSPWPAFANPQPAAIGSQNTQLPAAPSPAP